MKINKNEYFKSRTAEFVFYLTETDGILRNRKLGITPIQYCNKELAGKWRDTILSMMEEDHQGKAKAIEYLEEIYKLMITR